MSPCENCGDEADLLVPCPCCAKLQVCPSCVRAIKKNLQRASARLAEQVFADPVQRERFEAMARRSTESEPVRDEPDWMTAGDVL